jgi:hypothetical protein
MTQQTSKAFRFSEDELDLLATATKLHGSQKAAIVAGLKALQTKKEPTDSQLLAMLKSRLAAKAPGS